MMKVLFHLCLQCKLLLQVLEIKSWAEDKIPIIVALSLYSSWEKQKKKYIQKYIYNATDFYVV